MKNFIRNLFVTCPVLLLGIIYTSAAAYQQDGDNRIISIVDFDAIEINLGTGGIIGGGTGIAVTPETYNLGSTITQTDGFQGNLNEMAFAFVPVSLAGNVTMTADDPIGTSSFNQSGNWDNLTAPTPEYAYFTTNHLLRTPTDSSSHTFGSGSLSIDSGGRFLGKSTSSAAPGQVVTVHNLILNGGYVDQAHLHSYMTLVGGITVNAPSALGALHGNILDVQSVISGSAPLTISGSINAGDDKGAVILGAANPYSGTVTVSANTPADPMEGLLQLNHRDALVSATLSNINATAYGVSFSSTANTGAFNVGALAGTGDIALTDTAGAAVTLSIGGNNASTTYSGALKGRGSLVKVGTGILTLAGANRYIGDTTISEGTLMATSPSLSGYSTVSIANGSIFELDFTGTNSVVALVLDGVAQPHGAYDSGNTCGYLSGAGVLLVQDPRLEESPYRSSGSNYFDVQLMVVSNTASAGSLRIAGGGQTATIYYDVDDAAVVGLAANALGDDVERVTGISPTVSTDPPSAAEAILIGTIGSSPLIDGLISSEKIDVSAIAGKWEAYTAAVVDNPMAGMSKALVIAGSDRRGTAYGVFSLSEAMGVSPWYWDVPVAKQTALYVSASHTEGSPGVKYQGIFINDEDARLLQMDVHRP